MSFGNQVQFKVYKEQEQSVIPVSFEELERAAKEKLAEAPYYYVAASAGGEKPQGQTGKHLTNGRSSPECYGILQKGS